MTLKSLFLAAASLVLPAISNLAAACDFGEVPCCPLSHPASCGGERDSAFTIDANITLGASPETLSRAFLVDVKLVLENGVVNSTSFTQDEIRQGTTSKTVQLASIGVVTKCLFTWIHQPQAADIKPRGMQTSEEDVACSYNPERNSFDISPKMSVKKLAITVVPSAFDSRGATNLIYGLQAHDASAVWG